MCLYGCERWDSNSRYPAYEAGDLTSCPLRNGCTRGIRTSSFGYEPNELPLLHQCYIKMGSYKVMPRTIWKEMKNRSKTHIWCRRVGSNHHPAGYESAAPPVELHRHGPGLTILPARTIVKPPIAEVEKRRFNQSTAKEIALPLLCLLSTGGIYGISGVTKPHLWLTSKMSITRPGWICTIVLHIISMTLSY